MQTQAEKDKSRKDGKRHVGAESQLLAERDELRDTLGATATALARLLNGDVVKMPPEYRTELRKVLQRAIGVLEAVKR